MPRPPLDPPHAAPSAGVAPEAGGTTGAGGGAAGSSVGPSFGASLMVHGAVVASIVLTLRATDPPRDRRGPASVSARLEAVEPRPALEPDEVDPESLPVERTLPMEELAPELDEFSPEAEDPLSDAFAERPSVLPRPEPVINPFVDPHAVLDGVRIRPIERTVVEPPPREPAPVERPVEPAPGDVQDDPDPADDEADGDASPEPIAGACPPPIYPPVALRRGWEGTVVLLIDVAADGSVTAVRIETSSGHGILDDAAVRAVQAWRFTPGRSAGAAAATTVRKPIQFGS